MIYQNIVLNVPPGCEIMRVSRYHYVYLRLGNTYVNGKVRHKKLAIGRYLGLEDGVKRFQPNTNYFRHFNKQLPSLQEVATRGRVRSSVPTSGTHASFSALQAVLQVLFKTTRLQEDLSASFPHEIIERLFKAAVQLIAEEKRLDDDAFGDLDPSSWGVQLTSFYERRANLPKEVVVLNFDAPVLTFPVDSLLPVSSLLTLRMTEDRLTSLSVKRQSLRVPSAVVRLASAGETTTVEPIDADALTLQRLLTRHAGEASIVELASEPLHHEVVFSRPIPMTLPDGRSGFAYCTSRRRRNTGTESPSHAMVLGLFSTSNRHEGSWLFLRYHQAHVLRQWLGRLRLAHEPRQDFYELLVFIATSLYAALYALLEPGLPVSHRSVDQAIAQLNDMPLHFTEEQWITHVELTDSMKSLLRRLPIVVQQAPGKKMNPPRQESCER